MKKSSLVLFLTLLLGFAISPAHADVVHACAAKNDGDLRIVSSPGQCNNKKEFYVSLSSAPDRTVELCALYGALIRWGMTGIENPEFCPPIEDEAGLSLRLLTSSNNTYDVTDVYFAVFPPDAECNSGDPPIASEIVPLLSGVPSSANAFFVLNPGDYLVCLTPLQGVDPLEPSNSCFSASGAFSVVPGETTEHTLVMQCLGDPTGGIDIGGELNGPPHISDIHITPSQPAGCQVEVVDIVVVAQDPDDDDMAYQFDILEQPSEANASLSSLGESATLHTNMAGDYQIQVIVGDIHGASARLSFPIHVYECSL